MFFWHFYAVFPWSDMHKYGTKFQFKYLILLLLSPVLYGLQRIKIISCIYETLKNMEENLKSTGCNYKIK